MLVHENVKWVLLGCAILLFSVCNSEAHRLDPIIEHHASYYKTHTLTGDWGGVRSRWHENGFDFELEYFGDFSANLTGGANKTFDTSNYLEAEVYVDAERWLGWNNARFFFLAYALGSTDPSVRINTRQTISNLEATDTLKLFEAWWEQGLWDNRLSIRAGLYSLDTEFEYKPTANFFINGVFGTGVDLTEVVPQGPAIYPLSALGVRFKLQTHGVYLQTAVVDGIPGDPDNPHGTQVVLDQDDGLLIAGEIGYLLEEPNHPRMKLGLGVWVYTTRLPDLFVTDAMGNPVTDRGRHTVYGFIDLRLFSEPGDRKQGLDGFFRAGVADTRGTRFDRNIMGGLAYTGLFPSRDSDVLGLAASCAWAGDGLKELSLATGNPVRDEEIVLELTYILSPLPWLTLQPNMQYFIHPGLNPNLDDALFMGLRVEVEI